MAERGSDDPIRVGLGSRAADLARGSADGGKVCNSLFLGQRLRGLGRTSRVQFYDVSEVRLRRFRLARDLAINRFEAGIGKVERADTIARVPVERQRDRRLQRVVQQNGNEPRIALGVVEVIVKDRTFPVDAAPFIYSDLVLDLLAIGRRADEKNEARCLRPQLLLAPMRPALRRTYMIAVDLGVDAERPQLVGKPQNSLRMLGRVMTIADEDLSHGRLRDACLNLSRCSQKRE